MVKPKATIVFEVKYFKSLPLINAPKATPIAAIKIIMPLAAGDNFN